MKKLNRVTPHGERLPRCGAKTRAGSPCRRPAGLQTPHVGQGKCSLHGGLTPIKHGRYSTITRPAIRERLDALHAADPDPLDLLPELQMLRALTMDFIERYDRSHEALLAWHANGHPAHARPRQLLDITDASRLLERIARIVDTIHKRTQEHTISLETFHHLMEQMGLVVARYVGDADTLRAIETGWGQIRVEPSRLDRRR
jgi:hypothetical protein